MRVTDGDGAAWLHALLPAPCLGCERVLPAGQVPFALCRRCRGRLVVRPRSARRCRCCAIELASPRPSRRLCGACRHSPPGFIELVAPWAYRPPLSEVILALKFRRLAWLGERLAAPLAEVIAGGCATDCDLVVPVPLHWRRRLGRGYNQAAVIAHPLARRLGRPVAEVLVRRRSTPPQTALPRSARRGNLRGAFRVSARSAGLLARRRVLLVDDVVTTGATLDAAARALVAAGALEVCAAAVARTPGPG